MRLAPTRGLCIKWPPSPGVWVAEPVFPPASVGRRQGATSRTPLGASEADAGPARPHPAAQGPGRALPSDPDSGARGPSPPPTPRDSTTRSLRGHTADVRTLRDGLSGCYEGRERVGDPTGRTPRRRCASETPVAVSLLAPREQHGDGQGRGLGEGAGPGSEGGAWGVGASRSLSATLSPTRRLFVFAKSRFLCGSAVPLSSCCVPAGEGTT